MPLRLSIPCACRCWRKATPALLLLMAGPAFAEQRLDLEGTAIFGNKESPNVLYVVPWRKPDSIAPMGPPKLGQLDELLAPLDRDVFRRRIEWHQTFNVKK